MTHFEASRSYQCESCGVIGDRSESCACCGSQSIFNVARVLDRSAYQVRREVAAVMGMYAEVMQERIWA